MKQRRFAHGDNPGFSRHPSMILLPFGKRSFLPAAPARRYSGLDDPRVRSGFAKGLDAALAALAGDRGG